MASTADTGARRPEARCPEAAAEERVTCSVTEHCAQGIRCRGFAYNSGVPKRYCTSRAEWRLQPGKPAEPLSPHYRLDCDYGTGVITCWEEGGSEPIYVCESHAKQLGRPRKQVTDIRIITPQPDDGAISVKIEEQTETQEVPAPAPPSSASPEPAPLISDVTEETVGVEQATDRTEIQVAADPDPKPPATPETTRFLPEAKVARATDAAVRPPARDRTYGNSAKAMVDEAIWNLASGNYQAYKTALEQGKSAAEAAQAAGGQLAVVHRKIGEYTLKLEAILSESKATINVEETIDKPLEQAVLETIGNGAMSDSEKDAAIQRLGTLQEWAKHGLRGDVTPLEANRILLAIGDRVGWGGAAGVSEELKPVYRTLYVGLKTAIRNAVPEAQNLHERLSNLYAAKADLEIS